MVKDHLEESYNVNLIVNLLVHYPDIFTITFNLESSSCCLTYMIGRELKADRFHEFRKQLEEHLEGYYFLCKKRGNGLTLRKKTYRGMTRLEINLRAGYLPNEEIGMITRLMRHCFSHDLLSEVRPEEHEAPGDALAAPGDLMELLLSRNSCKDRKNLFAFRDSGKVYVFDK